MCSIDTVDDLGTVFHRHNLSGQLIKLEDWYRVHYLWTSKNALFLAKPCFGEKNTIC